MDEERNNSDPAAGVGTLLSQYFASKILTKGSVGTRIVWVRLDGPVCPLFVDCLHLSRPHKYKTSSPCAEDVIDQLENLLTRCRKLKPTDYVIVMGDFNCEVYSAICRRLHWNLAYE